MVAVGLVMSLLMAVLLLVDLRKTVWRAVLWGGAAALVAWKVVVIASNFVQLGLYYWC